MQQFTTEQIQDKFERLPSAMQAVLSSPELNNSIISVAKKHGLLIDQLGELVDLVGLTMLGLVPAKDFVNNLAEETGLNNADATVVTADLNTEVFSKMRSLMQEAGNNPLSGNLSVPTHQNPVNTEHMTVPAQPPKPKPITDFEKAAELTLEQAVHSEKDYTTIMKQFSPTYEPTVPRPPSPPPVVTPKPVTQEPKPNSLGQANAKADYVRHSPEPQPAAPVNLPIVEEGKNDTSQSINLIDKEKNPTTEPAEVIKIESESTTPPAFETLSSRKVDESAHAPDIDTTQNKLTAQELAPNLDTTPSLSTESVETVEPANTSIPEQIQNQPEVLDAPIPPQEAIPQVTTFQETATQTETLQEAAAKIMEIPQSVPVTVPEMPQQAAAKQMFKPSDVTPSSIGSDPYREPVE